MMTFEYLNTVSATWDKVKEMGCACYAFVFFEYFYIFDKYAQYSTECARTLGYTNNLWMYLSGKKN